ncbi:MAG: hypothetical protein QOG21_2288 [Actinomycetota bacterium]|nr:hypothetical protein [Actinomycetota bacterium]
MGREGPHPEVRAQAESRPVSRILYPPCGGRRPSIWDERCRPPRATYPGAPFRGGRATLAPCLVLLRTGFT